MERLWQRPSNLGTESSQLPLGLSSSWDTLWHGDGDQGRGEGHREHCVTTWIKSRLLSSFLTLTSLMEIFCLGWVLSSVSCYHACRQISIPLLLAAPKYWTLQNLANWSHYKYVLCMSDGSSGLLGQTSIHHLSLQQMFHPFSYPPVFSLSRGPQLLLYKIIKATKLESTSPLCYYNIILYLNLTPCLSCQ